MLGVSAVAAPAARIPLTIERVTTGVPVTFGVPFPKGALRSPDHVRVLDARGIEIPSQITEVASWLPASDSLQWVWVDFVTDGSDRYEIEYGPVVRRKPVESRLRIVNSQRPAGGLEVDTGAIRFRVPRGAGGFIEEASVSVNGTYRGAISSPGKRGSFLDLLDDAGPDRSEAFVTFTSIEKGSGPLHAILRVEGEYRYARADNRSAPFVTRIHVWSGKPWMKVLHTIVYTGSPDKRRPQEGQHRHVATKGARLLVEDPNDHGFVEPNDRIAAAGLSLPLAEKPVRARTGLVDGDWWIRGRESIVEAPLIGDAGITQTGPKPDRMPPVPESKDRERIGGFEATVTNGSGTIASVSYTHLTLPTILRV